MRQETRVIVAALAAVAGATALPAVGGVTVDFEKSPGKVRPELHASHIRSASYPRGYNNTDEFVRPLNLTGFRVHDCPLESVGQQICDTHCIFPLMHLDPKDPKNYVFRPTDHFFDINFAMGLKAFYRLGTSIEHSNEHEWGYNTLNPPDHEKYAEVLAGIVRHYTKGWANGYYWGNRFIGWELLNEPDVVACWRGSWVDFRHLYMTCYRRLKSEFPEITLGGPAFGWLNEKWIREFLIDCRDNGIKPDFLSWHAYEHLGPDAALVQPAKARAICDELGFTDMKLYISEWHYVPPKRFRGLEKGTLEDVKLAQSGPQGIKGIDSAVFALQVETGFHDTPLDEAYYYISYFDGPWGYANKYRQLDKVYYHLKLTGEIVTNGLDRVACASGEKSVRAFGAWAKDRSGVKLLVSDYRGSNTVINVSVAGAGNLKPTGVRLLDNTHDLADWKNYTWQNGALTLKKDGPGSCAFAIDFR